MQGLNEDQIIDLKLKDPWTEKCIPSGGAIENKGMIWICFLIFTDETDYSFPQKDIYNRRNGQRPNDSMVKILQDTITKEMINNIFQLDLQYTCINVKNIFNDKIIKKSKESISKKKIDEKVALTLEMVQESIDNMKGACMIVYPMVTFV